MRAYLALSTLVAASLLLAGCTQIMPEESVDETANESAGDANQTTDGTGADAGGATPTPDESTEPPADPVPPPAAPAPAEPAPASPAPPAPAPAAPAPGPATPAPAPSQPASPPPSPAPTPPSPQPASPPPSTTPQPAQPSAWPREGSYVTYQFRRYSGSPDSSYSQEDEGTVTWTYRNGDWTGACTYTSEEFVRERGWMNRTGSERLTASNPPHWPPFNTKNPPAQGQRVETWYIDGCRPVPQDFMLYAGTETESATVQGRAVRAATHLAEDADDGSPSDFRSEWSRSTGLVLYWEWQRSYSNLSGRLVDTDAPLG